MEKRRVTITVGGQPYSFASDDPDEYIRTLEKRTNAALKETAEFAPSAYAGAILAVISQTDRLLRAEEAGRTAERNSQEESFRTGKRPGFHVGTAGKNRDNAGNSGGSSGARRTGGEDAGDADESGITCR